MMFKMDKLLRCEDIAKILSVHRKTVSLWAWKGLLPALKIDGAIRFRREDVKKFIISNYTGGKEAFFRTKNDTAI